MNKFIIGVLGVFLLLLIGFFVYQYNLYSPQRKAQEFTELGCFYSGGIIESMWTPESNTCPKQRVMGQVTGLKCGYCICCRRF